MGALVCGVALHPRVRRFELRTNLPFFSVSCLRNKNSNKKFQVRRNVGLSFLCFSMLSFRYSGLVLAMQCREQEDDLLVFLRTSMLYSFPHPRVYSSNHVPFPTPR
jgi:hypothetical protein